MFQPPGCGEHVKRQATTRRGQSQKEALVFEVYYINATVLLDAPFSQKPSKPVTSARAMSSNSHTTTSASSSRRTSKIDRLRLPPNFRVANKPSLLLLAKRAKISSSAHF